MRSPSPHHLHDKQSMSMNILSIPHNTSPQSSCAVLKTFSPQHTIRLKRTAPRTILCKIIVNLLRLQLQTSDRCKQKHSRCCGSIPQPAEPIIIMLQPGPVSELCQDEWRTTMTARGQGTDLQRYQWRNPDIACWQA